MSYNQEVINGVLHDLRTPISRIRFSLKLLEEAKNNYELNSRTSAIEEDIAEIESLISEILDYGKLDQAGTAIKLEKIHINKLLESAIDNFKKLYPNKSIIVEIPGNAITLLANAKHIMRALQNLLQNAGRFSNSLVKLSFAKRNSCHHQISIEDDGPGIPSGDRERIFEPFVQLKNQPKNISHGYGFGLAITKKILDQHDWKIAVTDSDMGGAKILITIPS